MTPAARQAVHFSFAPGTTPGWAGQKLHLAKDMRPLPTLQTSKPQAGMSSSLDGVHRVDSYTGLDILIIEMKLF